MNKLFYGFIKVLLLVFLGLISVGAKSATLDDIEFASLPNGDVQVKLIHSEELTVEPLTFTIDDPARLAIDLQGVELNLANNNETVGIGSVHSLSSIEAAGRTRVVINLSKAITHELVTEGNTVLLLLKSAAAQNQDSITSNVASLASEESGDKTIENIDFRRGPSGEGRIVVTLADPTTATNMSIEGGKVIVEFFDALLPSKLDRRLDVIDFATPVKEIDTKASGKDVRMVISAVNEDYDHLAYQSENIYTIEFKPLSKEEAEEINKEKFGFTGERLSLNFQNIEVRAVLQLLADFTGLNLVTSDSVNGNLTLRLKNVPWDQALDIILKARGLGMRQSGNVMMIAPQEEITARERLELEASRQVEELAPLRTEFLEVSYANATEMASLIQSDVNSLLSERGSVSIDQRTNTLIVQDVAESLIAIRELVTKLDVPIKQVLIESRIVNADENFAKDIGVRFGYSKATKQGVIDRTDIGGDGASPFAAVGGGNTGTTAGTTTTFNTGGVENLIVDLPVAAGDAAAWRLAVGKVGSWLLQLELSALLAEGRGEDIASPKVITSDQTEAVIESGVQIPYQEASSSGATTVSFQDAVLSLTVTPQITPDDSVLLDLAVTQDVQGSALVLGVPTINTRNIQTQILVDNGETVVLGGVYTQSENYNVDRIPFFSDLPYVGFLFKRTGVSQDKTELLIFVTPKILKDSLKI